MENEPAFDAADLADAILGPAPVVTMADGSVETLGSAPAPSEPITADTPIVPAWAAPPPASSTDGPWSDAQRALLVLAVLLMMVALVGIAAMSEPAEPDPPCNDAPGLFDDVNVDRGLFAYPGC